MYTYIALLLFAQPTDVNIVCVTKAPVSSPVTITYEGIEKGDAVRIIKEGFKDSDTFIELYDANNKPITLFWSLDPGPRTLTLIVAKENPLRIEYDKHVLDYGGTPTPVPPNKETIPTIVAYVAANTMDQRDLLNLTQFYSDFANELEKSNLINTAQFREAYIKSGVEFFNQTNIKGKYPGLAEIVDKVLVDALSLQNVPIDKVKTVKLLKSIAWSFGGTKS